MRSTVGIRELRQNLSKYVERVKQGETLEVLERGRPVALLAPLRESATALDRLVAAGRVRPACRDLLALGPPIVRRTRMSASQALQELREES